MNAIYTMKGVQDVVEVFEDKVTITPKGVLGFLNKGIKGTKDIPLESIVAIQFKEAGLFFNGYLQFTIAGGNESRGGLLAAIKDENTFMFAQKQNALANQIKAYIDAGIRELRKPQPTVPPANLSDELQRLAMLKEQGILTEEEFQVAKKKSMSVLSTASTPPAGQIPVTDRQQATLQPQSWWSDLSVIHWAGIIFFGVFGLLVLFVVLSDLKKNQQKRIQNSPITSSFRSQSEGRLKQPQRRSRPRLVGQLAGTSPQTSEYFTINSGHFKITYSCTATRRTATHRDVKGHFFIVVRTKDGKFVGMTNSIVTTVKDTFTLFHQAGTFYLEIHSVFMEYKVKVEEI